MDAKSTWSLLLASSGLACGGAFGPDRFDLAFFEENFARDPDDPARSLFGAAAVSGGLPAGCDYLEGGLPVTAPGTEGRIVVSARQQPFGSGCSYVCGDEAITILAEGGDRAEARREALADCDRLGPDPLFQGPMLPLRGAVEPAEYVLARSLWTSLSPRSASLRDRREAVALGLAARGIEASFHHPLPRDLDRAVDLPAGALDGIDACRPLQYNHHARLLFDPSGRVAARWRPGVDEEDLLPSCVAAVVDAVRVPPRETWSAVDLEIERIRGEP